MTESLSGVADGYWAGPSHVQAASDDRFWVWSCPAPLCPPQIPHDMTRTLSWAVTGCLDSYYVGRWHIANSVETVPLFKNTRPSISAVLPTVRLTACVRARVRMDRTDRTINKKLFTINRLRSCVAMAYWFETQVSVSLKQRNYCSSASYHGHQFLSFLQITAVQAKNTVTYTFAARQRLPNKQNNGRC
jgi:hypothetical protein